MSQTAQRRPGALGQAIVELVLVMSVLLMILLSIMEFGFAFAHHITLEYATREGARMGAALANGTGGFSCNQIDDQVVAAVQRVLTTSGSQIDLADIGELRIYRANASGQEEGPVNVWVHGKGPKVDGVPLEFKFDHGNWNACSRQNAGLGRTDSIGISLTYDYRFVTPLGSVLGLTGTPHLGMADRTVMALNP